MAYIDRYNFYLWCYTIYCLSFYCKILVMKKIIRPMLTCSRNVSIEDLQSLQMPMYASIKQDGIRCRLDLNNKSGFINPMSRSLKELPNCHIQEWAKEHGIPGLDGEIVILGKTFNEIQSWVMTEYPPLEPFEFRVFDYFHPKLSFEERLDYLNELTIFYRIKILKQTLCKYSFAIEKLFNQAIREGEEGLILRSPSGLYKSGRSTWNEAYSLKMKAYEDDEANIVSCYPLERNDNPKEPSRIGLTKRSSHQSGKTALNILGGFFVRSRKNGMFRVGSGFTNKQRTEYWMNRYSIVGREITYKWQPKGSKDKPRTPIFKSLNP